MRFKTFNTLLSISLSIALFISLGTAASAAETTTVKFGNPPWPGVTVKTAVARQLLDATGYRTSTTSAGWIICLQGVAGGKLDADLGIWLPAERDTVNALRKSGKIKFVATNIADAKYSIVVPEYVWKAGVHSIADLHKYPRKFDRKIYGIESGAAGNGIVATAIKKNTYDLKGWELVPSSTAGMLSQAGRAIKKHEWVAFLGWKPHWMNIKYKLRYLEDPKNIWGGSSTVHTAANPDFIKQHPNVARFLHQMIVPAATQSHWIYDYSYKKTPADTVAKHWIKGHMGLVAKWLDGVRTADGSKPAIDAVKAAFAG